MASNWLFLTSPATDLRFCLSALYRSPMLSAFISQTNAMLVGGARSAFDVLLPPQCPITGEAVSAPGVLSAKGWAQVQFIDDPVCAACGVPFAYDHGDGAMCGACIANPPSYSSARAAVSYNDASRRLIIAYKHSDRTELAPMFSQWMARAAAPLATSRSIFTPVPLHPRRLLARRFNQSALLAERSSRIAGCAHHLSLLKRTRATPPQQMQPSAEARKRNVAGAFEISDGACDIVKSAHIILVDDVLTTGATLSACARPLKRAGAVRVDAVVLARLARDGKDAI